MKPKSFKKALSLFKKGIYILLASAKVVSAQGLLWEVSGNGLQNPSWIYGTIHVGDKRVFDFKPAVMQKFGTSKSFAMELHPDSIKQDLVLKFMAADSGKTLKDYFTPDDYLKLDIYCKEKLHIDLNLFQQYKPFLLYSLVIQAKFGNEMGQALDLYFYKKAKESGKNIYGIEKPIEQFEAIETMGDEGQSKMLIESLDKEKTGDKEIKKLIKYYVAGDLEKLVKLMNDEEMSDAMEKALLEDRNHVMADRVVPMMMKESTFIAVGAAHLPGQVGLLELLRKKGFIVKSVK